MVLPTRASPSFSHNLYPHQKACTRLLASSTRGQTEEARRATVPQAHHRKLIRMKKQSYVPDEGTRKTPEKWVNVVEIRKLPKREFRIMIVKMIQGLGNIMEKMQEMFTKDPEGLKNKERWTIYTTRKMNSRATGRRTDDWPEGQNGGNRRCRTGYRKRMKRNEDRLRDLWDNIKRTNIWITGVSEGEEREKGPRKIFGRDNSW